MNRYLPEVGYVRLETILGNPKAGIPAIIPVSSSTWWEGVKSGRFPGGFKISERVTAWKVQDILALIESIDMKEEQDA